MRARSMILVAALCVASVGCGGDEPDETEEPPLGAGPFPVAQLSVDVSHPERAVNYQIGCQGDTATLFGDDGDTVDLDAQRACRALATTEAQDLLIDGPPADRVCTEIYGGPDVARILGTLDGADVDATIDRTNGCGINDWDSVLADILPTAIGG